MNSSFYYKNLKMVSFFTCQLIKFLSTLICQAHIIIRSNVIMSLLESLAGFTCVTLETTSLPLKLIKINYIKLYSNL